MGTRKVKNWTYQKKPFGYMVGGDPAKIALHNQIYLANYELRQQEEARRLLAADKVAIQTTDDLVNRYTDWDLGCAVLVAKRRYDISAEEGVAFLTEIQDLTRQFVAEGRHYTEVWDLVREEVGIDIEREY